MNGVSLSNKVIHWNPNDFAMTQNFNKVIKENDKVSNDYYWKSNKYEGVDCFGRALDLTSLINKPNGYLQGKLSDTDDVDYYKFNIGEYRTLSVASEKYDLDFTITLDNIPEGCDYDLILYDSDGNQVGIGQDNGNGGNTSLADLTVENGRIKGLDSPLDKLLNNLEQNQTYLDYRADIFAIKNYERLQGNSLLESFSARYVIDGNRIRVV